MQPEKSVCDIFREMEHSDKALCSKQGKEWLENYKKSEKYCGHVFTSDRTTLKDMEPSEWRMLIKKIASLMKTNSMFLSQLLNETIYNSNDSNKIVSTLCKDICYYFESADSNVFYGNGEAVVDLYIGVRDIYILGRLIAPFLIAGYTMRIKLLNESILPYLVAIGDIITNAGVIKGTKYVFINPDVEELEDPKRLIVRGDTSFHYCPMVIFEESDLDSAVDCLIESSRRFNGMLYWSVSHAYIQESVFTKVVKKLEGISKRNKNTEIYFNPRDFSKCDSASDTLKFCIGWDPRDLEMDCNLTLIVSLLPFRSLQEVVTIVNSQNRGCAVSLWAEKLSIVNSASKLLKFNTVWVNSHGLVDSVVPLECFNETALPLNGVQLLEYLTSLKKISSDSFKINLNHSDMKDSAKYFSESVKNAVDMSSKGSDTLKKLDNQGLQNILNLIHNDESSELKSVSTLFDTIYHPSSELDVLCFSDSYKIVMLIFTYETLELDIFLQVWCRLIATRNAVIVCASSGVLETIAGILPSTIPEGIVTLLDLKHYSSYSTDNKGIGKILYFNLAKRDHSFKFVNRNNNDYLTSIFLSKKLVWMPTY